VAVAELDARNGLTDFEGVDVEPVRGLDPEESRAMVAQGSRLRRASASWEERLDGRLAQAVCGIQAVKGVAFGDGFDLAEAPGSQAHDEIMPTAQGVRRMTDRAGGLEGGMTTGEPLIVQGALKPIPTLTKPLRSVDISTREPAQALRERTDSSVVPAGGVVGEAMVAFVLADAYRRKFGGDHIDDVREAVRAYEERIGWKPRD
jgi:chorismate synthase